MRRISNITGSFSRGMVADVGKVSRGKEDARCQLKDGECF